MTLPTLHPNGTPARMLAASAEAAYDALQAAYELLRQTGPDPRDFEPGTYELAVDEHRQRLLKLLEIMSAMELLAKHCTEAGER